MLPDAYACVVVNRFGNLLDDDADPFDLLNDAEAEKDKKKKKDEQKKKKEQLKKSQQKKPGARESQKERRVPFVDGQDAATGFNRQQGRGGPALSGGRGGALDAERGSRRAGFRENRVNQDEQPLEFSIPKPSFNADFDPRGRGGGRGGRRGGGRYFVNSDISLRGKTKREYERHSGTGISPEEKRGGRGPWNWGPAQDTMGEGMEVEPDAAVKPEESQPPVEGEEPIPEVEGEVEVQVAMEMSFDEWKSLQEMNRPKVEFNLRKPESKVPSKARVIHQSKKLEKPKFDATEDMEGEGHFLRKPVNDITSSLDINFGSLGRPTRGGRGRGRGGATGRPEKIAVTKTKQDEGPAPNPDDPEDFPALTARK